MSNLELNEGQEFFIGGQRYAVKDGAPVQEAKKRGPLGGELVRFDSLKKGDRFALLFEKDDVTSRYSCGLNSAFNLTIYGDDDLVEINVPHQAKGRVMTAGEAAKLPDIVGKRVAVDGRVVLIDEDSDRYKLSVAWDSGYGNWFCGSDKIEVLD